MIKILYITNGINGAAGLERVLSIKATLLADEYGYDVHIAVLNRAGENPFYHFSDKIKVHSVPVSGNLAKYLKMYISGMRNLVASVKPEVISVCDDGLKGFFLPLILRKPCPMIYERHVSQLVLLGQNPSAAKQIYFSIQQRLMRSLARKFDRLILLTEDNRTEWDLPNVEVISNPLPFFPSEVSNLENRRVIAVGRQSYQKGFDRLLYAWKQVSGKNPDWTLAIFGKSNPDLKLPELAEALGISETVQFRKAVPKIEDEMVASSMFAFSSRFEGFGMVLIEAMACGLPCVSFDCPCGPSEIVDHGKNGYLVPNGDIETFAARLNELIQNDELRKAMGTHARGSVGKYLPETILKKWDTLFKSLVNA